MRKVTKLIAIMCVCVWATGCQVVEDGTEGIRKVFGEIESPALKPGLYANIPLFREVEIWNVKTQRRSVRVEIPSVEGLVVGLETSVLYRPIDVVRIRKEVGQAYVDTVLLTTIVNVFREVIGKQRVEDLIKSQETLTSAAEAALKAQLAPRGILVESLLVTGLVLPPKFKEAVERKLQSEQLALQKEFELQQAVKDAEIEQARARGAAEAQKIIRSTLTSEYLQYLWISTLNENPNVIYVATEANMPMFRTLSDANPKSPPKPLPKKE